ncbi:MAG: MFS transporter [Candidatus Neomarinimicrobiota bacterium]
MLRPKKMNRLRKNISLLWAAQLTSGIGDAVYQVALMWLVLDLTGSPAITGLVAMSVYLPALIFGLFAGVLSDRYNRQGLMILANIGQAVTVMMIPLLLFRGSSNVIFIGLLAFLRSCFSTLFPPAFNSFIPTIVPRDRLVQVNSILVTAGQLAYFMGPALVGILLGLINLNYLFIIDGFSFLAAMGLLLLIIKPAERQRSRQYHKPWEELKQGLKYIFSHESLGFLFSLTFLNNLFIMGPAIVGVPILVKKTLEGTAANYAFIESGLGLGMLCGSMLLIKFGKNLPKGRILALGMILDGLTYSVFYFAGSVQAVFMLMVIHGVGIPMITVPRTAIIQKYAQNKYHGRLFSMIHLAVVGMTALSSAVVGILGGILDIRVVFLVIGLLAAGCGLTAFFSVRIQKLI